MNFSSRMYLPVIISVIIFFCLWVYFLILIRNAFLASGSIHLNVIEQNDVSNKNVIVNSSHIMVDNKKRKKIHVPKFMLELYEKNKIGGMGAKRPDVVRSLIPTHAEPIHGNEVFEDPSENHLLIFNIPASAEDEQFVSAELKILTLLDIGANQEIGVKRILKMSIYDETVKHLLDFQEIQIHHFNNSWISFDVTEPVKDILKEKSSSKYLKIVVTVSTFVPQLNDKLKLSLMPAEEDFEHDYPVLLLSYSSTDEESTGKKNHVKKETPIEDSRKKRSIQDPYEEKEKPIDDGKKKGSIEEDYADKEKPIENGRKRRSIEEGYDEKDKPMEDGREKRSVEEDYEEKETPIEDSRKKRSIQEDNEEKEKPIENGRKKRSVEEDYEEKDTPIEDSRKKHSFQEDEEKPIEDGNKKRSIEEDYAGKEKPIEDSRKKGSIQEDYEEKEKSIEDGRKKRSIEEDYEEETNRIWTDDSLFKNSAQLKKFKRIRNACRRRPLYVDFAEIKYDVWIVQPSGYEAYQCQGRCFYPVAEHLNPTKHAIVQALLHSVAPNKVTRSCCVPTTLDSISILYVDTNGVLTYRYAYKDMVVVECGCR